MKSATIEADFLAARAKTAVTVLNATGWDEGFIKPDCVSVNSVFFYVLDQQSKWVWSCGIPKASFYLAVSESAQAKKEAVIACCEKLIAKSASLSVVTNEQENDLANALTAYISITQSYQLTERATKQNHFGVIRYGITETLRPFAMSGSDRYLIPADAILETMKNVVAMDSNNHPKWIGQS